MPNESDNPTFKKSPEEHKEYYKRPERPHQDLRENFPEGLINAVANLQKRVDKLEAKPDKPSKPS